MFVLYCVGDQQKPFLANVRNSLSFASGDTIVDDLIALGYLQVNTGNYPAACELFEILLNYSPDLPAAHLALGKPFYILLLTFAI